ncbi:hypothetical protein LJC19_04910 [Oxalobacter sp. OttesenSCG-928-P03]|nr:hypothetical protein [Oxalobacter sp. OttesenSCG-928-P03]
MKPLFTRADTLTLLKKHYGPYNVRITKDGFVQRMTSYKYYGRRCVEHDFGHWSTEENQKFVKRINDLFRLVKERKK